MMRVKEFISLDELRISMNPWMNALVVTVITIASVALRRVRVMRRILI